MWNSVQASTCGICQEAYALSNHTARLYIQQSNLKNDESLVEGKHRQRAGTTKGCCQHPRVCG